MWTTNPITGVGAFMPIEGVPSCDYNCSKARDSILNHVNKCMRKKGWWLESPDENKATTNSTTGISVDASSQE